MKRFEVTDANSMDKVSIMLSSILIWETVTLIDSTSGVKKYMLQMLLDSGKSWSITFPTQAAALGAYTELSKLKDEETL